MNSNRRVLFFVIYSLTLYLLLSIAAHAFHFTWLPFSRVNLISDVLITDTTQSGVPTDHDTSTPVPIIEKPAEDFNLYHQPQFITNFSTDTNSTSLPLLMSKLHDLKSGKKRKIRIAYFGDSMIEGDLLTQTLRLLLQQQFGGNGVGFVPITSQVSKFRQTVSANYSPGWEEENFKEGKSNKLFLSGHLFHTGNGTIQMTDNTIKDSAAITEKTILYGQATGAAVNANGRSINLSGNEQFNRMVLDKSLSPTINVSITNNNIPVYGLTFESDSGIFVDNFSFRGITGIEYAKIDSGFMAAINQNNAYDLIVFQYGVNLLFRPNDKNFNWYARALLPIINKLHHSFSNAEFILVSTADRAFRYGSEYKSAVGIDSLIKVQAQVAYQTGSAFYNQYETMGGKNSIVDWANRKPSLANKDYVHPNHRGAEILGGYFYEAIMDQYQKYLNKLK